MGISRRKTTKHYPLEIVFVQKSAEKPKKGRLLKSLDFSFNRSALGLKKLKGKSRLII